MNSRKTNQYKNQESKSSLLQQALVLFSYFYIVHNVLYINSDWLQANIVVFALHNATFHLTFISANDMKIKQLLQNKLRIEYEEQLMNVH